MSARRIIGDYLLLAGSYGFAASLTWGINTLFLLGAGLDILQVFLVNAVFTGAIVLFEVPTGALADAAGRRLSFLLSLGLLAAASLGYPLAARLGGGVPPFLAPALLLGLGATFYSGSLEAWLVDALAAAGYGRRLDHLLARADVVVGAASLLGTVAGGLLADLDLGLPYLTRAAILLPLALLAAAKVRDLGSPTRSLRWREVPAAMRRVARAGIGYGWRSPEARWLLLAGVFQFGFLTWGFHAWQPYFLALLGRHAVWTAGVIGGGVVLATMSGSALVPLLTRLVPRRTTLLLATAGLQTAAAMGIGLAGSFPLAVALLLLVAAATGAAGPVKQAYLHQVVPSSERATLVSCDSLLRNAGGMAGQTGLGALARERGIAETYLVGGLLAALALPLLLLLRRGDGAAEARVER